MMATRTLFLAVAVLAGTVVQAQEAFTLKYDLTRGKTYRYVETTGATRVQEMAGQEMKITSSSRVLTRSTVEDVTKDGSMVLVTSADSLVVSMKSPRMDTTMVLTDLMGKRRRVVMTPAGVIVKRETLDSVRVEGQLRAQGGREYALLHQFAGRPVKPGEKWKATLRDTAESMGGKIVTTMELEYALVGRERQRDHDCVRVTYTGTSAIAGKGSRMGMDFYIEGTGKVTGAAYFDAARGAAVLDEMNLESDMTMAMTGQQNMTMPISSTAKTTRMLLD